VIRVRHLSLEQEHLPPSGERVTAPTGYGFLYLERGQAYWLGQGLSLQVNAGETLIVPPRHSGVLRASRIGEVTLRHFEFNPAWLIGFFTLPERRWLGALSRNAINAPRIFQPTHPVSRQFLRLAAQAHTCSGLEKRCAMLDLATTALAEQHQPPPTNPRRNGTVHERFITLVSQMTDGELSHYEARELASLCGCSRRYLVTLFRHCFGLSIRVSRRDGRLVLAEDNDTATGPEETGKAPR